MLLHRLYYRLGRGPRSELTLMRPTLRGRRFIQILRKTTA